MPINIWWALAALFAALLVGSIVRLSLLGSTPAEKRRTYLGSLLVWWILALLVAAVSYFGRPAAAVLFAAFSLIGLTEYLGITRGIRRQHKADLFTFGAITLHYVFIALDWPLWSAVFLPIFVFLLLPTRVVLTGEISGFVHDVGTLLFGVMLVGYSLSHAAMLFLFSATSNPVAGASGWFLYLVILTELNDIAQALWGRQIGRHRVAPHISPNKTWEGLLMGMATTLVVAVLLAPLLTPLADPSQTALPWRNVQVPLLWPLVAGLIIAIGGFFGDLTISAVKRDVGVKDCGSLLPGQGGILDRVDSLLFTAPLFYYYVRFLFGGEF